MMRRLLKAATAVALLLAFSLELCAPARGQLIGVGRARERRIGRVVLPTPPFNPDAGILDGPKGRGRNPERAATRRRMSHHKRSSKRQPRLRVKRGRSSRPAPRRTTS